MFTNIVARWPGSTHDSHVFRSSSICNFVEKNHHSLDDGILLGDSGYACQPFMMTPYSNPSTPAQASYNNAHCKTRVKIEQTFGQWKRRFHVLHSEIRMAPEKVCLIIGACAILHNIAILLKEPMEDGEVEDEMNVNDDYHGPDQEIIFVAPILARLVPSFHHHFLCTLRDTVTIYSLKTVLVHGMVPTFM